MMSKKDVQENDNTTIQQEMTQLSEMIAWFQSDDFSLEAAVDTYKKAEALAGKIEKDLSELKNEITVIKQRFDA
ncbi:exodeoxyribonuclease VII small subunit [Candidatus Saccharibacteria bacterium TM7i]|nr:exodeoxyribonuclease VII small subunit [Candidatus Saccharibacteria bacterium TM7i]